MYLCLNCIWGQQYRGFWGTEDVHVQNSLLDLKVEIVLSYLLYEFFRNIFWEELHFKVKVHWIFTMIGHILIQNLQYRINCSLTKQTEQK